MKNQKNILLQPMGKVSSNLLNKLQKSLSNELIGWKFSIADLIDFPPQAFDPLRGQYLSPIILTEMHEKFSKFKFGKILCICNADAYSGSLNFVFGEAEMLGNIAIIYLARLYPEFYGLPQDQSIFFERVLKEAVHELGHSLGLQHCIIPTCVMFFSNSIADTDNKKAQFCIDCRSKINSS